MPILLRARCELILELRTPSPWVLLKGGIFSSEHSNLSSLTSVSLMWIRIHHQMETDDNFGASMIRPWSENILSCLNLARKEADRVLSFKATFEVILGRNSIRPVAIFSSLQIHFFHHYFHPHQQSESKHQCQNQWIQVHWRRSRKVESGLWYLQIPEWPPIRSAFLVVFLSCFLSCHLSIRDSVKRTHLLMVSIMETKLGEDLRSVKMALSSIDRLPFKISGSISSRRHFNFFSV